MDISDINVLATVGWMPEDELPVWVDGEVYDILFASSEVDYPVGARYFPYISLCGKIIFLITQMQEDEQTNP